jgi:hypothetical protein
MNFGFWLIREKGNCEKTARVKVRRLNHLSKLVDGLEDPQTVFSTIKVIIRKIAMGES